MKSITYILILFIPFFLFSQRTKIDSLRIINSMSLCYKYSDNEKDSIGNDVLESRLDIVRNCLNIIANDVKTVEEFRKVMPNYQYKDETCHVENFELGNNIKSTLIEISTGGNGSFHISFISEDDLILKMRIIFEFFQDRFVYQYLIPEINFKIDCLNGFYTGFEKTFHENLKLTKNKRIFIESYDENYRRKTALNYFGEVFSLGELVEPYYFEYELGQKTFEHIRYFIINKDYEAMENLLYSVSPTSRLLIARTLKYMIDNYGYKPDVKIQKRMLEISKEKHLIRSRRPMYEEGAFGDVFFDLDKNFEIYLKTY